MGPVTKYTAGDTCHDRYKWLATSKAAICNKPQNNLYDDWICYSPCYG